MSPYPRPHSPWLNTSLLQFSFTDSLLLDTDNDEQLDSTLSSLSLMATYTDEMGSIAESIKATDERASTEVSPSHVVEMVETKAEHADE